MIVDLKNSHFKKDKGNVEVVRYRLCSEVSGCNF